MNTKQADQLIKSGERVTLRNTLYNEQFAAVIVRRDRYNVYTACGMVLDRKELTLVGAS